MAYPNPDPDAPGQPQTFTDRYWQAPVAPQPATPTQDLVNQAAIRGTLAGGTSPGVGRAGSTDVTDQTNLDVAAAMERADLAGGIVQPSQAATTAAPLPTVAGIAHDQYAQERQGIDKQRAQIMARLGIIPPQQAGWSAVVLASPHERVGLMQNLSALEDRSNQMLREQHYAAVDNARQLHEQTALQTGIHVSNAIGNMMSTIRQANQQYGAGTPAAKAAILDTYLSDSPDIAAARGHKAFEDRVGPYIDMHDLAAKRTEFVQAFGREPTSVETTSKGGTVLRAGEEKGGTAAEKELKPYGVSPEQIQNPIGARVGKMGTDEKGNPVFTPTYEGDVVELQGKVTQGGKTHIAHVPLATYQKYGGKVGAPPATTAPTTQPAQGGPTLTTTPTTVATKADFDALPKGAHFLFNGKLGTKH